MCYSASDFFWNKAIFEEHGLDPEQPPTTVEELWDLQEEFDVYEDDKPVVLAFHPKASMHAETWALCFGGQFWDPETLQVTPQHPGNVVGTEWMLRYAEKYGADTLDRLSQSYGQYQSANNPFLSGVLVTTSFWDAMVAYRDGNAEGVEMGFSNFPHPEAMPEQEGFGRLNFNPTFCVNGLYFCLSISLAHFFFAQNATANFYISARVDTQSCAMEKLSEALEAVAAVRYLVNTFLISSGVMIGTAFSSSLRLIKGYKCT